MTDTSSLRAFIEARLAEDETWALGANRPYEHAVEHAMAPVTGVRWRSVAGDWWEPVRIDPAIDEFVAPPGESCNLATVETWPTRSDRERFMPRVYAAYIVEMDSAAAGHIARHDPARVLREVAAKRAILTAVDKYLDPHPGQPCTNEDNPYVDCELHSAATGRISPDVLPLLASVWSDHADYDPSWSTA
jgi:hypothetical protein